MNKRQGVNDYAMTYADASEASYLVTPHMVCIHTVQKI